MTRTGAASASASASVVSSSTAPQRSRLRKRREPSTRGTSDANTTNQTQLVYNPRVEGYLAILLASLVNFASISDISVASLSRISLKDEKVIAIFGAVSFLICCFILIFDRIRTLHQWFDFKEVCDGKLEGYTLLFLVIWWIVGVAITTKADGIAYRALNTYFSSWCALVMSVLTLDQWTSAKDILSIHELTRLSDTLPYWYALFLCSLVEMGSAIDVFVRLNLRQKDMDMDLEWTTGKAEYAIAVGAISAPIALCAILAHYKLLCCGCEKVRPHGGVTELSFALLLFLWWIVAVSLLTADDAVASTIQGGQPIPIMGEEVARNRRRMLIDDEGDGEGGGLMNNATMNITTICECWNQTNATTLDNDDDLISPNHSNINPTTATSANPVFPGNNLYLSLWLGLYSSAKICLKWKAARAMVQMSDAMRRDAEAGDDVDDGLVAAATGAKVDRRRLVGSDDDVD